ncbi:acetyltransferase [Bacillus salipaludis]|uniref:Acetyltransferase n=1 Tax=Bacillus salipaludis TaxID=2547811 RepID=A0ABW8R929_9BACI
MNIAVIGRGGHSKVVSDMIFSNGDHQIVGYLDDKYEHIRLIGNTFCGPISSSKRLISHFKDIKFVNAIGDNKIRQGIVRKLNLPDEYYLTIIHKSAIISQSAKIGFGTVVMPNVVINANTNVGSHSIINTGSIIEHDSIIGNFSHVCPGATLTGAVQLGEGDFIGAGATIIPNIHIGEWTIVGAGSTVIHDIPSYCTVMGIPATVKKYNQRRAEVK